MSEHEHKHEHKEQLRFKLNHINEQLAKLEQEDAQLQKAIYLAEAGSGIYVGQRMLELKTKLDQLEKEKAAVTEELENLNS